MKIKNKRKKKKIAFLLTFIALSLVLIVIELYGFFTLNYYSGIPLGGDYENIVARSRYTRSIPLELVYHFEFDGELPKAYPDGGFYDIMSVTTLNEMFAINFETEDEWVAISQGREIGQLVYDVNWRLANYEKSWGSIAIPKYERDYSPNTVYVYTSIFPLNELYSGEFHGYFSTDKRYVNDRQNWPSIAWQSAYYDSQKRNWWEEFLKYVSYQIIPFEGTIRE
jgi:hypothetical protein